MTSVSTLNEARRKKALDRLYNFGGMIQTLGEFIASKTIVRKSSYTEKYASKKVDLCYKKLKTPKISYTLWYIQNGSEIGTDVPKLVYDSIDV
ncbi:MAG TPA: hypothetical protein VFI27_08835 [candidate division Zixibacteria bacterium]|nr:hypothetical protein [candidate division Zixibacteria bacterium]